MCVGPWIAPTILHMAGLKFRQLTAVLLLLTFSLVVQTNAIINPRKLDDDQTIAPPVGFENRCGNCPCDTPCHQSPPPPPKKKKKKKKPPSPPPPGGQYSPNPPSIYINGPPGNLYPIDAYRSCSTPSRCYPGILAFLIGAAAVGFLLNAN